MNVIMISVIPVLILLILVLIAMLKVIVSPRSRLLRIVLPMAMALFVLGFFVRTFSIVAPTARSVFPSMRDVRHANHLEALRTETEAAARRHAAEMYQAAESVLMPPEIPVTENGAPVPPPAPAAPSETPVVSSEPAASVAPLTSTQPGPSSESAPGEVPEVVEQVGQAVGEAIGEVLQAVGEVPEAVGDVLHAVSEVTSQDELQALSGVREPATTAQETPPLVDSADAVAADTTGFSGQGNASPDWVRQPPSEMDGHLAIVLISDPFEDRFACDEDLDRRTREAIGRVARQRCQQRGLPLDLPIDVTFEEIGMVSQQRHYQTRPTSVGDMIQGYQLTVMDDAFQSKLDRRIADAVVDRRLTATGLASGSVLGVVALLFGAFRFAARKAPDPLSA